MDKNGAQSFQISRFSSAKIPIVLSLLSILFFSVGIFWSRERKRQRFVCIMRARAKARRVSSFVMVISLAIDPSHYVTRTTLEMPQTHTNSDLFLLFLFFSWETSEYSRSFDNNRIIQFLFFFAFRLNYREAL